MSEQERIYKIWICERCRANRLSECSCPTESGRKIEIEVVERATAQARERGGERVADLEEVLTDAQTVIAEIAKLLGPVGPDEVLDQDKPAIEGRRWILSDENGMRITRAYRLAHTFVIEQRYDAALASGDQGEERS